MTYVDHLSTTPPVIKPKCQPPGVWLRFTKEARTLNFWRWGIQAIVCVALTSVLVTIRPVNEFFQFSAVWAVQSALLVLDGTTGASIKRSAERVAGTVVGGLLAFVFLHVTIGSAEHSNSSIVDKGVILGSIVFSPFIWGWIRVKTPNNVQIATCGIVTTYLVLLSHSLGNSAFSMAVLRIVVVTIGVLVNTFVVHLVVPRQARDVLKDSTVGVFMAAADMLKPLLEINAGMEPGGDLLNPNKIILKEIAEQRQQLHDMKMRHYQKKECREAIIKGSSAIIHLRGTDVGSLETTSGHLNSSRVSRMTSVMLSTRSVSKSTDLITQQSQQQKSAIPSQAHLRLEEGSARFHGDFSESSVLGTSRNVGDVSCRHQIVSPESSLFNSISNVSLTSLASAYYYEQESRLAALKGEALRELVADYASQLELADEARQNRWKEILKSFQQCQDLLNSLDGLVIAARQEVRCGKGPALFPSKQYSALIAHMQGLFHNISSLVFSVDLQIAQVTKAKKETLVAFGSGRGKDGASPGVVTDDLSSAHKIFARIAGAFLFTDIFGTIVGQSAGNIREAVRCIGQAIKSSSPDTTDALEAIDAAAEDINLLNTMRNERAKIYADIFTAGLRAEALGRWSVRKQSSFGAVYNINTSLPWEKLMGLDAPTFRDMSRHEHQAYWESYWAARDRLSVATGTLMLLRDQLYVVRGVVDDILNPSRGDEYIDQDDAL